MIFAIFRAFGIYLIGQFHRRRADLVIRFGLRVHCLAFGIVGIEVIGFVARNLLAVDNLKEYRLRFQIWLSIKSVGCFISFSPTLHYYRSKSRTQ